jgi:hypothetical protein
MNPKLRPDIAKILERWPEKDRALLLTLCEIVSQQTVIDCANFLSKRKEHHQAVAILEWSRAE